MIDLRSDTVTKPTPAMGKAMAEAKVGDDVYREDPTIHELERLGAELLGKEASLFVPSGTMGNLLAVLATCRPGDEIIMEEQMHMFWYEAGNISALAGVQTRTIPGIRGAITPEQVREALRPEDIHFPVSKMLCLENTHNRAGGTCLSQEQMDVLSQTAHEGDLWVHVDGARIFNAAAALNTEAKTLIRGADSIMTCLSKGLAAPVGSLLAGPRDFVERARRYRKMLGGGMRQAGVLAAAGIIALQEMRLRLGEDHQNARKLAEGLLEIGYGVDLDTVQTNILRFTVPGSAPEFVSQLKDKGILANSTGPNSVRMVTHYQINAQIIHDVLRIIKAV